MLLQHLPGDGLGDTVHLLWGRGVQSSRGEHKVDGIKESGQGSGQIRILEGSEGLTQRLLGAKTENSELS